MIGAPWYLLAAGIALVILGYFVDSFSGLSQKRRPGIHHKMRDEEIIKSLKDQEAMSASSAICLLGYILVGISIFWRISRYFT
jgi:hypothetical protein